MFTSPYFPKLSFPHKSNLLPYFPLFNLCSLRQIASLSLTRPSNNFTFSLSLTSSPTLSLTFFSFLPLIFPHIQYFLFPNLNSLFLLSAFPLTLLVTLFSLPLFTSPLLLSLSLPSFVLFPYSFLHVYFPDLTSPHPLLPLPTTIPSLTLPILPPSSHTPSTPPPFIPHHFHYFHFAHNGSPSLPYFTLTYHTPSLFLTHATLLFPFTYLILLPSLPLTRSPLFLLLVPLFSFVYPTFSTFNSSLFIISPSHNFPSFPCFTSSPTLPLLLSLPFPSSLLTSNTCFSQIYPYFPTLLIFSHSYTPPLLTYPFYLSLTYPTFSPLIRLIS